MDRNIRGKLQKTFKHMKERCYDKNDKRYTDWGGRGIGICQEWLDNPESFIDWSLSNGCDIGLTIDRKDNDGDYSPDNCRWVTRAENNQNRRSSRFYTLNGKTQNLQQWCNEYGLSWSMVNKRLEMGWDFEKAITTPKKQRNEKDLIGRHFGRLKVIEFYGVDSNRQSLFKCECKCKNITIVGREKLISGHTSSCGCFRKEMYERMKKHDEQPK